MPKLSDVMMKQDLSRVPTISIFFNTDLVFQICTLCTLNKPEMHIQIAREYFETYFHNRSADFSLNGDFYERVVQRQDLEVEWSEQKCKIKRKKPL